MEQFTEPVEEQNDGQETAAAHPLPVKAGQLPECTLFFPVRGLTIGTHHTRRNSSRLTNFAISI